MMCFMFNTVILYHYTINIQGIILFAAPDMYIIEHGLSEKSEIVT